MKEIIRRWRQKRIAKEMRKAAFDHDLTFNNDAERERINREQVEEFVLYYAFLGSETTFSTRTCPKCGERLI